MLKKSLLFLFFAGLICFAFADGGSDDDDDMDVKPSTESDTEAEFESTFKGAGLDGKLKFKLEIESNEVRIELRAFNSVGDDESAYRVRIGFSEIVEYTEVNGVAGFQPGEDTVDSTLKAADLQYDAITCAETTPGVFTCTVQSKDGQLKVVAVITSVVTNAGGLPQKPTSVKFTVDINLANRNVGSRVALITEVRTEEGEAPEVNDESEEEKSGFTDNKEKELVVGSGAISWSVVAVQNGLNITVINSGPIAIPDDSDDDDPEDSDSEEEIQLIFSFDTTAAGLISWDPKVSFRGAFAGSAVVTQASALLVAACAFFAFYL